MITLASKRKTTHSYCENCLAVIIYFNFDWSWISFQMGTHRRLPMKTCWAIRCLVFIKSTCYLNGSSSLQSRAGVQPHMFLSDARVLWKVEERWHHLLASLQMLSICISSKSTATELMHFSAWSQRNGSLSFVVSFSCRRALQRVGYMLVSIGYLCDMLCNVLTHYREICFSYFAGCTSEGYVHLGCICT